MNPAISARSPTSAVVRSQATVMSLVDGSLDLEPSATGPVKIATRNRSVIALPESTEASRLVPEAPACSFPRPTYPPGGAEGWEAHPSTLVLMADQRIERAEQLAALGRHNEVLEILADPGLAEDPDASRMRVFALLNTDRPAEAHREADHLVAIDPDSPLSFLARSYSWERLERPWESLRDARSAVSRAPHVPLFRSRLATCLARSGQLDEAHSEVGWVLSQEPDDPDHWVLLGRVYYHLNRLDEAEGAVLEALRLDAQNTEAKLLLAGVQAEGKGRTNESIETLIDVLRANPAEASIRQMLLDVAFPRQLPWEFLIILMGLAVMLGGVVAVPLALTYGGVVAYRYRKLTPQLRAMVWAEPTTRRRMQVAIVVWTLGVVGTFAAGLYLGLLAR